MDSWWIKDDSVEMIQDENDPEKYQSNSKYPNGRWIYVANRSVILDDRPCKLRHFPLVDLILSPDPESDISGITNIDLCKQQQIDANEVHALTKDIVRANAYIRGRADPSSGVNPKKIRNYAGTIVNASPSQFSWDSPNQAPNELFRMKDMAKSDIEYVSALTDISQGRRPASITSADGLRILQESSRTVLRPKTMMLEDALQRLGQLEIDFIQTGYDTKRMIRIEGNKLILNETYIDENGNQVKLNDVSIGLYDVRVEADSTMPRSRIERFDTVLKAAQAGFADRKAVLQESGLPNWLDIEERMAKKEEEFKAKQEAQEQAQMQAGNQPTPVKQPNVNISYKDLPPEGKVSAAELAGIDLSGVPQQQDQQQGQQVQGLEQPQIIPGQ
jgi:hypothetical protein